MVFQAAKLSIFLHISISIYYLRVYSPLKQ